MCSQYTCVNLSAFASLGKTLYPHCLVLQRGLQAVGPLDTCFFFFFFLQAICFLSGQVNQIKNIRQLKFKCPSWLNEFVSTVSMQDSSPNNLASCSTALFTHNTPYMSVHTPTYNVASIHVAQFTHTCTTLVQVTGQFTHTKL